ncbi:hypothetical protein [Roseovarius pacificus]|uniref:hypothetical protein n=1 Tax=Roseovarius pacificus TaxID=337701 RepID=UPI00403A2900
MLNNALLKLHNKGAETFSKHKRMTFAEVIERLAPIGINEKDVNVAIILPRKELSAPFLL